MASSNASGLRFPSSAGRDPPPQGSGAGRLIVLCGNNSSRLPRLALVILLHDLKVTRIDPERPESLDLIRAPERRALCDGRSPPPGGKFRCELLGNPRPGVFLTMR